MKWEYFKRWFHPEEIDKNLDALGEEGWELVCITYDSSGLSGQILFVFKRSKS